MERWMFSTRGLVLGLGVLLALAPAWLPPLAWLDGWLYGQAAALDPSVPERRVVLAEVPGADGGDPAWMAAAAETLPELANAAALAVVVPDHWLPALRWTEEGRLLAARLQAVGGVLGVGTAGLGWQGDYPVLPAADGPVGEYLPWLPSAAMLHPRSRLQGRSGPYLPTTAYPAAMQAPIYPLVWHGAEAEHADLAALLAARSADESLGEWRRGEALSFGERRVPTGLAGHVMVPPHAATAVARWQPGSAPVPELDGRVAILAPAGSGVALASATAALIQRETAYTPYWAAAAGAALTLILALYAAVAAPRFGIFTGAVSSLLLLILLVGASAATYLKYGIWLAWTPAMVVLAAGHPLAMLARIPARRQQRLITEREHALRRLGAHQVDHGDYEEAFVTLRRCRVGEEVLDLVYRCATALERKRQYAQAREIFDWLNARRPGYRDVKAHLESLRPAGGGTDAGQTLVIADGGLNRPLIGRYEVVRELGRGATGVVYLGRDPKIGREVAIKTLAFSQFDADDLETFKSRFAREAEAAGRLSHPNIVTVYDVGEEADLAFIAMDYATGRTLSAYTAQRDLLPVSEALGVLAEVADALEYAHSQGIVHRDIKPANIIYDAESARVKVTDFGIARVMDSSRTRTGSIVGTPSYMAPEQLTGNAVDGRTDIFSLGVTLYQLVTAEVPFRGENLAGIAYQITSVKPRGVRSVRPELPAAVSRIVNRALQKSPEKRYQAAGEMAQALRKAAARVGRGETATG